MMSVLFSSYSCSQGTDEELISKDLDALRMEIYPKGCIFYIEDTLDNKPEEMMFLINRVLKTWGTAFTCGFEAEQENYEYIGDIIMPRGDDDEIRLVAGTYHAVCYTYDEDAFEYDDVDRFLFFGKRVNQIGVEYKVGETGIINKPARLFSAYLDNYKVDEFLDGDYFSMDPECLTQRYVWEFYVKKTDAMARIDAVEAEIDGVPVYADLRTQEFDASRIAKVKAFGVMSHEDSFEAGVDTVRLSVDVLPLVAPSHIKKLSLGEGSVGNMNVRMTITSKDGKSRDWLIRHRMDELDSIPVYDLHDDMIHISKKTSAPDVWEYKIEDDILVNRDTITSRRYGKWQVIK